MLDALRSQVQFNCDISDARHAGNYTLCIYLLKMREFYRWLHALDFEREIDGEDITRWLREREDRWDAVIDEDYRPLELSGAAYDPFDNAAINRELADSGLFYHGGIGQKGVDHFFLAERVEQRQEGGVTITIAGAEYARDLTAPPAMSTRDEIILRRESLKRMCWERYQEWAWNRFDNAMGTALACYDFDRSIADALEAMVDVEQHTVIRHELGEMAVTREFGSAWPEMMQRILGTRAELLARAARDHLADALSVLPWLAEQDNPAPVHFYFANLTALRRQILPMADQAYRQWLRGGNGAPLLDLAQAGAEHWRQTLRAVLDIAAAEDGDPATAIAAYLDHAPL
jgi:hypothetical protein